MKRLFKKMIGKFFALYAKHLSDKKVEKRYIKIGWKIGFVHHQIEVEGECSGFRKMIEKWGRWEREYARRGYRTITLNSWVEYGGCFWELKGAGEKRGENEEPIFHAETYKECYLGKIEPITSFELFPVQWMQN